MARIKVTQDPDKPVAKEVLAESIVKVGEAAESLRKSGLNEKAIVVLLHDATKVGRPDIRAILNGLRQLKGWYCK